MMWLISIVGNKEPTFDARYVLEMLDSQSTAKQHRLNSAIASLIEDFDIVHFIPMDKDDEDSISVVLQHVDNCIQCVTDLVRSHVVRIESDLYRFFVHGIVILPEVVLAFLRFQVVAAHFQCDSKESVNCSK